VKVVSVGTNCSILSLTHYFYRDLIEVVEAAGSNIDVVVIPTSMKKQMCRAG